MSSQQVDSCGRSATITITDDAKSIVQRNGNHLANNLNQSNLNQQSSTPTQQPNIANIFNFGFAALHSLTHNYSELVRMPPTPSPYSKLDSGFIIILFVFLDRTLSFSALLAFFLFAFLYICACVLVIDSLHILLLYVCVFVTFCLNYNCLRTRVYDL
jgi:hypothetical protein